MILINYMLKELLYIGLQGLALIQDNFNNQDKILRLYKKTINIGKLMININRNISFNERSIISSNIY